MLPSRFSWWLCSALSLPFRHNRKYADLEALSESRLEPWGERHRLAWAQACCPAAALARHLQGVAAEPVAACLQHLDLSAPPFLVAVIDFQSAKVSQVQGLV